MKIIVSLLVGLISLGVWAKTEDLAFVGTWKMDLRTAEEVAAEKECGLAFFELHQSGERITGDHSFATVGCGRINEGSGGSVNGVVVADDHAILTVKSARNAAIAFGEARLLPDGRLEWRLIDYIQDSNVAGDSPLILAKGILARIP